MIDAKRSGERRSSTEMSAAASDPTYGCMSRARIGRTGRVRPDGRTPRLQAKAKPGRRCERRTHRTCQRYELRPSAKTYYQSDGSGTPNHWRYSERRAERLETACVLNACVSKTGVRIARQPWFPFRSIWRRLASLRAYLVFRLQPAPTRQNQARRKKADTPPEQGKRVWSRPDGRARRHS